MERFIVGETFGAITVARKTKLTLVAPGDDGDVIPAPRKLGPHGNALWIAIQRHYAVDDAGGIELLLQCCEASDLAGRLQAEIDRDGPVLRQRSGVVRDHPGLKHLLAAKAFICRTLARLGLDV